MTRDAAGKGELREKSLQPACILRDVRIELAVGAFQVGVRHQAGPAVARASDKDHVQFVLLDDAINVNVDEVEAGRGAPVTEKPRLDVLQLQRLEEQGIVIEVDLADRQVIRGAPVGIHLLEQRRCQGRARQTISVGFHIAVRGLERGGCHYRTISRIRSTQPGARRLAANVAHSDGALDGLCQPPASATMASAALGPQDPASYSSGRVGISRDGSTTRHAASTPSSRANSMPSPRMASPIRRSYASIPPPRSLQQ